ncbi:hypothetical protein DUNSADRAFT_18007 [Dunaliella salina]|uniref:Uncharacterized protein n=1 Tax=Dunaliella salina TaxID=3046 RepID=A0ABQ7G0U3_DUNSA|nr:hypothetical protein DUNSADRAFT_18007 [Dunaliella salina]|eukprot:KAF5828226.1 hypothetical protein DUNSADRAFT_18007 [Dunaliella salina]
MFLTQRFFRRKSMRRNDRFEYLDQHKEEILVAERAVLYTLGFDLNAQHPYSYLVNRLAALGLLQVGGCVDVRRALQQ